MSSNKLEGEEEYANADSDAVGEEEGQAEVANGVSQAGLVGAVIAGRRVHAAVLLGVSGGAALPALELLDGVPEALLRFAKAALGIGIVDERRRGWWCHGNGEWSHQSRGLLFNPITVTSWSFHGFVRASLNCFLVTTFYQILY